MIEAKRTPCRSGAGVTAMGQRSIEHVASIWKWHEKGRTVIPHPFALLPFEEDVSHC